MDFVLRRDFFVWWLYWAFRQVFSWTKFDWKFLFFVYKELQNRIPWSSFRRKIWHIIWPSSVAVVCVVWRLTLVKLRLRNSQRQINWEKKMNFSKIVRISTRCATRKQNWQSENLMDIGTRKIFTGQFCNFLDCMNFEFSNFLWIFLNVIFPRIQW